MTAPSLSALASAYRALMRGTRLSRDASRAAFEALFAEDAGPALSAAFLTALAAAGETADELAGAVDVLRASAARPPIAEALAARSVDVCGTGGDGLGTFNISTAAAFVVAGAGVPVAKHGGRAVSSSAGSADVLAALGVDVEMPAGRAAEALEEAGVTFLFAPLYHPAMKRVAPLRRELGVRTTFNLAGPLSNPARVPRQVVGVDRPARVSTVAGALAALGTERALVFSNEAGGDELLPFGRTEVAEIRPGEIRRFELSAADFGLAEESGDGLAGGDAATNGEILLRVLEGETGPRRTTVLMNAAAALVVAGTVGSLREGVAAARESIDGGRARAALASLVAISTRRVPPAGG